MDVALGNDRDVMDLTTCFEWVDRRCFAMSANSVLRHGVAEHLRDVLRDELGVSVTGYGADLGG